MCAVLEMATTLHTTSPELAASLTALRPRLLEHACKSSGTGYFGDHIVGALLPHLVEHLTIDLLVERFDSLSFVGATTWFDRDKALMQVRVACANDDPPLYFDATKAALIEAVHLINQLLVADKSFH